MTRTTPPRPLDVEAVFPELGALRRGATRLHPRRGVPTVRDSSVGGSMLWPDGEPWPVCAIPHKRGSGYRYSDVVREREVLERAWRRDPRGGPNAEEVDELGGFKRGRHAPYLADTDPVPLIAVAQLYRRDVPGLPDIGEGDLLQVFWCGFERHGDSRHDLHVELRWRHSEDVTSPLAEQPAPQVVGRRELVPALRAASRGDRRAPGPHGPRPLAAGPYRRMGRTGGRRRASVHLGRVHGSRLEGRRAHRLAAHGTAAAALFRLRRGTRSAPDGRPHRMGPQYEELDPL